MKTNKEILEELRKANEIKLFGVRVKNRDIEEFRDLQEMLGLKASDLFSLMIESFEDKYTYLDFEKEGNEE